MASQIKNRNADNNKLGCCIDVGMVIDNDETTMQIERMVATEGEALALLADLTQRAEKVQSEPCKIDSCIDVVPNGLQLTALFHFCCSAERLLFQLSLR